MWFQKNKWKIIVPIIIVAVLVAAFYFGGNAPGSKGWEVSSAENTLSPAQPAETPVALPPEPSPEPEASPEPSMEPMPEPDEEGLEEQIPEVTPGTPEESEDGLEQESEPPVEQPEEDDDVLTCTIYIQCETIINNFDLCDPAKQGIVPMHGWILGNTDVEFTEGETVFDVLQRVCKDKGIHMEYSESPMYGSVYIEGIANLYEFDVGNLSGWMYKVNGWFPNYGCSLYTLKDGDIIGWVYTCDLGHDVGGGYSTGG